MISLLQPTSSKESIYPPPPQDSVNEFPSLDAAVEPFVQLVKDTGSSSVKLNCSLPAWNEWAVHSNLEINDLHQLHIRLILFLRAAVHRLRTLKIHASYHLSPCQNDSSYALVRASPSSSSASWGPCVKDAIDPSERSKVFVALIANTPTLIVS